MDGKRGRGNKRALEADESQSDGEMVGNVKARRGSLRGGEEKMVEGLARAVQGQGPARAVLPPQPVKRMGKSRAASSDLFLNTTR